MAWEYSEKTQQLFMDAVQGKPGTHLGEVENADGIGEHGSIACGDALRFTFRVKRDPSDPTKDIITEALRRDLGLEEPAPRPSVRTLAPVSVGRILQEQEDHDRLGEMLDERGHRY